MILRRWQQREAVRNLRQQGLSYREILARVSFRIARSTISNWCKDIELTSAQLDRLDGLYREGSYRGRLLGPKAIQDRRAKEVTRIKAVARDEVSALTQQEVWVAGLMLYWAEGDKQHRVGLTNSDPELVRFMMGWFRGCCHVPEEKFRAHLHIHSGQDKEAIKSFWSRVTGIPPSRFGKFCVKQEGTGHRKHKLYHGTVAIAIRSKDLLYRIQGWIEGFSQVACGPLAQLAEHLTLNQGVDGSIPSRPTSFAQAHADATDY